MNVGGAGGVSGGVDYGGGNGAYVRLTVVVMLVQVLLLVVLVLLKVSVLELGVVLTVLM